MTILLTPNAEQDLRHWQSADGNIHRRIAFLLEAADRDPFRGAGRPVRLRVGCNMLWSRIIDGGHRLIYEVRGKDLVVHQCRYWI